jgi:hypothetical protein
VLAGEQINLKIECDGSDITGVPQWNIPGTTFKDWQASPQSGVLTPLSSSDLEGEEITFYWADGEDDREVSVEFEIENDAVTYRCQKNAVLNVKTPASELESVFGTVDFNSNGTAVGLFNHSQLDERGAEFVATVKEVPGFEEGGWNFVQLVKITNAIYSKDGECKQYFPDDIWLLDVAYPYEPTIPPYYFPATKDIPGMMKDSPSIGLGGLDETRTHYEFRTYVMFIPAGTQSKWVPLFYIPWHCNWCATRLSPGWSLVLHGQNLGGVVPTDQHPCWTENKELDGTEEVVFCPPPCGS